ncbi:MAG: hypothetical protein NC903_00705, partial [Candidatus Omnitrophica bacterium]|nr:hypothetical protein [Candidatus Omnitrophota bacterium]
SARELWKELGRPKIYWFPTEHHSIFLFSPLILAKIKRFLNSKIVKKRLENVVDVNYFDIIDKR